MTRTLYPEFPGMHKVYFLGFNPSSLHRDKVTKFLDQNPISINWITILPGQVFFVSDLLVGQVTATLRGQFPNQFLFVAEVNQFTCDGWMPREIWNFIHNPSSAKPPAEIDYLSSFTQDV